MAGQPRYLALDTETGGRTVKTSLLTGYFAAMDEAKAVCRELQLKLGPPKGGYVAEAQALMHNGIDLKELAAIAVPLEEGRARLASFLQPYEGENRLTPLGQNISFDLKFIWEYLMDQDEWLRHCTEEVEDTFVLAKKLRKEGKLHVNAMKLGVLCEHLGVPLVNAHSEKDDTIAAAHLHTRLKQLEAQPKGKAKGLPPSPTEPPETASPCPLSVPLPMARVRSSYSILQSPTSVDDYVDKAAKTGAPCLAIADLGYATSALELWTKAKAKGVLGIPAQVAYVADGPGNYELTLWATTELGYRNLLKASSLGWSQSRMDGRQRRQDTGTGPIPRVTLEELLPLLEGIAVGTGGAGGLLARKSEGELVDILARLTGSESSAVFLEVVPRPLTHRFDPSAGGFAEIQDEDGNHRDLQADANEKAFLYAGMTGLPLILSADAHYAEPSERDDREMLVSNLDQTGSLASHMPLHVPTTDEAWARFSAMHPGREEEFSQSVLGGYQLAEMARGLEIKATYRMPDTELPEDIKAVAADHREGLKALIFRKIEEHGRMKWDDQAWTARLAHEMDIICDNGVQDFAEYFTFLERWNSWTREHSILSAPGRGSGAGSLLCYLLKITHLDPFRHKLPFSRFLSPGRVKRRKWPDIDWDLGDRGPLLSKLAEVYGDKFCGCSTHGKLKVKSAIKDAFRSLQLRPLQSLVDSSPRGADRDVLEARLEAMKLQVERITKPIDDTPMGVSDQDFLLGYEDKDGNVHEGYLYQDDALQGFFLEYASEDPSKDLKSMVVKMLGIPRSVGRHASAHFVSNAPISENVPTCEVSGHTVTQFTAPTQGFNSAETAGLIKFDFLAVKALLNISSCIRMVHRAKGYDTWEKEFEFNGEKFKLWQGDLSIEVVPHPETGELLDVYNLPEDPEVCRDMSEGRTESVFQITSPLMTSYAKRIVLECLDDFALMVAIIRTGPLTAETEQDNPDRPMKDPETGRQVVDEQGRPRFHKLAMTDAYVYRKHGKVPVSYAHPDMEPILKGTHGVAVYQEDLQEMFSSLAGYSEEEADYTRELISKKKRQDMEKILPDLRKRLAERGWTDEQAQVFINLCVSSASYSFNRSHSASYGVVAYMCAWLKHHYPREWWTAVLQNCKVEDIREKGYGKALRDILVLPHVNGPTDTFQPRDDGKVHAPMWLVHGVGDAACKAISEARLSAEAEFMESGYGTVAEAEQWSEFKSMQDFFERCASEGPVNEGVVRRLVTVGAFEQVEPGKSIKDLMREYLTLKKVSRLKAGEGKKGAELKAACDEWYAKNADKLPKDFQESMALMEMDGVEHQLRRMELLPIYRNDVHEEFDKVLSKYIVRKEEGPDLYKTRDKFGNQQLLPVLKDGKEVAAFHDRNKNNKYSEAVWVGLLESKDDLEYADKKQQGSPKVKALKMKVVNAGDAVECILWPNALGVMEKAGRQPPDGKRILLCAGPVRPSRQPGMWSMSVNKLVEI